MSCNRIQHLLAETSARELTHSERQEIEQHISSCVDCLEESNQNKILSNIFVEMSEIDNSHIIPQGIMRARVENQLQSVEKTNYISALLKNRIFVPIATALLIILTFTYFNNPDKTSTPFEYTVALDGINVEIVEGDETLCDMLYTIGLPEASIDVIGCDTTCKLVIFDLKSQQEAEKVVNIINNLNSDIIKTKINKIKQYNIS